MRKSNLDLKKQLETLDKIYYEKDNFLSKDVLTIANKINSSRNIMYNSHLEQFVVLKNPEFPRIFQNYENEVGRFSSSKYESDREWTVVAKISKFSDYPDQNYLLVLKDKNNHYHIIQRTIGKQLTEKYCYCYNNENFDSKKVNDRIEKNEILYSSTSFDEDNNYCYGLNAKTCYLIYNDTIEDAITVSQSFAKRMTNNFMEEIEVNVNNNDILCNLYGDDYYKSFPDIGESTKDNVLTARRRINYDQALFDLQKNNLRKINYFTDTIFYGDGVLVDIDIFSNQTVENLEKYSYNKQILRYLKMIRNYHQSIIDTLKPIVESKDKSVSYSEDLAYYYKKSREYLNPDISWTNEMNDFDNVVIIFHILKEYPLTIGSKLSGRYGNKGVVSKILPDEEMPITEYGEKVEVIFNAFGVVNRLNPAQLYELELNFISNNIVRKMKELKTFKEKMELFFGYIKNVNKNQYNKLKDYYTHLDKNQKQEFLQDIYNKGIFIHQPPFWDNINFDELSELYDKYPWIQPYKCYVNGQEMKKKLIVAEEYLIKLKHIPFGKFSARSTAYICMKGLPSKSTAHKKNQELFSQTPIRLGEMEVNNLLLTKRPDCIIRMASMYSSSESNRKELIRQLLTRNIFDIDKINLKNPYDNSNRVILDILFKSIGIRLTEE